MEGTRALTSSNDAIIPTAGHVIFKSAIDVADGDSVLFQSASKIMSTRYSSIRNGIWAAFSEIDKSEVIKEYQKAMLRVLAEYCDIYPEAIHSLQWQERIEIVTDIPGQEKKKFNPSKSSVDEDGNINSVPFNRQLVIELCIDDSYEGGRYSWDYFSDIPQMSKGDVAIFPATFLWSREEKSIISGRRMYLRSFFNGGRDYFVDDEYLDKPGTEFLLSYMR